MVEGESVGAIGGQATNLLGGGQRDWPESLCYNEVLLAVAIRLLRKWWNWQTHHLEGVAPKGVGVQIPPSAP